MIPGSGFYWGISASAAQTEGSAFEDGRSPSIWDSFADRKNKINDRSTPTTATDFYHKFRQDIDLMSDLGIRNFRYSISWSRLIPGGTGSINNKGAAFYDQLVDYCLSKDITPWLTLYHWDLPQVLEDKGGWTNRDVVNWYLEYTSRCIELLGDRVKNWMVLNEPMAFTGAGYFLGVHAPGRKGLGNFLSAAHHAVLCTAEGSRLIRDKVKLATIGTTFSFASIQPYRQTPNDLEAAQRVDDLLNKFFLYPALGRGYPLENNKFLKKIEDYIKPGDTDRMKADLDFIGVQTYTREVVKKSWAVPFINATIVHAGKRKVPVTQMGWEVYPKSIYDVLMWLSNEKDIPPLIVTENGAAFADDVNENGIINDTQRMEYLRDHIDMVMKARKNGVDVRGYFVWSLTDNFEWAEGYRPRFGMVYVDYQNNLNRIVKESGKWYGKIVRKNELEILEMQGTQPGQEK